MTFVSSGSVLFISRRKWKSSFSQIKWPGLKPKPSRPHLDVEHKAELKRNQISISGSGICEEIEENVSGKKYHKAPDFLEILESQGCLDVGSRTYDALVVACIVLKSIRGVKKMLNLMSSSGFEPDQYMSNRVLLALVKCGMMIDARDMFENMPERNSASWSTMIEGLMDSGDYKEAFHLFLAMWSDGSDVDSRTLATIFPVCAGLQSVDIGKQLHSCAIKLSAADHIYVSCALINMYSKCGSLNDAQFVFDEMPEKTTVGWNTIISGYALNGYSEDALSLYYEMQASGAKMDHFTFSIVDRICSRLGSLEHAKQAHAAMARQGFKLDVVANTALLDLYSKWGRIEDAKSVFDRMPCKNILSWNALIAGYGNHSRGQEAVCLFYQMLKEGMKPNHVTFHAVLSPCSCSGLSDHGWEIFDSMRREHDVEPRAKHYACMIHSSDEPVTCSKSKLIMKATQSLVLRTIAGFRSSSAPDTLMFMISITAEPSASPSLTTAQVWSLLKPPLTIALASPSPEPQPGRDSPLLDIAITPALKSPLACASVATASSSGPASPSMASPQIVPFEPQSSLS